MTRLIRNGLGLVLFVGFWQGISMWGPREWHVPSTPVFVDEVVSLVTLPTFLQAVGQTVSSALLAVAIALLITLVVGVVFGSNPVLETVFGLPLEIIRPIPAIAIVPLAIIALGGGQPMELLVAVLACGWPILFNTIYGVRQVDPLTIDAARVMGLGRLQTALRVVVPSLLPFVIAGLRTAMPIALIIVIGAQYLSSAQRGIGGVLILATSGGDLNVLWATAAISGALGIALGAIVELAGRVLCPWAEEKGR